MADETPGVVNRQPEPTGGHRQWGVMVPVVFIGVLMMFTVGWWAMSHPSPAAPARSGLVDRPATDDVKRTRDVLEGVERGVKREQLAVPVPPTVVEHTRGESGTTTAAQADPIREAKRKREYESLFASNIGTPGKGASRPSLVDPAPATPPSDEDPAITAMKQRLNGVLGRLETSASAPAATPGQPAAPRGLDAPASPVAPSAAPPEGLHRVFEGQVFDAVTLNRVTSEMDSPVTVMLRTPIYAQDGVQVLPAGSKVLGKTTHTQVAGVTRIGIPFHRLILPSGRFYALDHFEGLNEIGDAGLRGKVNRHYLETFGASAAVGVITGLSQSLGRLGTGHDSTIVNVGTGFGDSTSQAVNQTMQQLLNKPWTVTLMEGTRMKVHLNADLDLPEWRDR